MRIGGLAEQTVNDAGVCRIPCVCASKIRPPSSTNLDNYLHRTNWYCPQYDLYQKTFKMHYVRDAFTYMREYMRTHTNVPNTSRLKSIVMRD